MNKPMNDPATTPAPTAIPIPIPTATVVLDWHAADAPAGSRAPGGGPAPRAPGRRHAATTTAAGEREDVTLARVMRSEWTKLTSLRSTVWTLVAAVAGLVGLAAAICASTAASWTGGSHERADFDAAYHSLAGYMLAQLAIGVLGVLMMSGEYATGMIRATLGAVPRRLPVLWAKATVFAATTFVLMLVASVVAFLVGQAFLDREHLGIVLSDPGAARAVLGCAFFVTVIGLLGLALGTLLRSTAGAVAALFGMVLVLPLIINVLPGDLRSIGRYLPGMAGEAVLRNPGGPDLLSPGGGFAVLVCYVAVALAAAAVALVRRDV